MGQIFGFSEVTERLAPHRDKKIVFTNGCFDLLHVGHIRYLQEARNLGAFLFVGINSDASVRRLKGKDRPLQTEMDRAEILAALGCVDAVAIFSEDTPENIIEAVRPNILVKGGDWKPEQIIGSDFVKSIGGEVRSLQFINGKSSTSLIEKARIKV